MAKETIRNFARHFTNLTNSQRRELERALHDLENSEEITNLVSTLDFLRRKPNQNLAVPQITATAIVRGAVLEWAPLKDQRISAYEIEFSTSANFSSSTKTLTFGSNAIIEGLTDTTFVRIRGIRSDGTQGPFSDTVTIAPEIFSINARTEETFYYRLEDNATYTILGGSGSDFEYTPINAEGISMVWGTLHVYGNPEIEVHGIENFTIKLISRVVETSTDTEQWRITCHGYDGIYHIGPVPIQHPEEQQTLQIRIDATDNSMTGEFYPSEVLYAHLNGLELGSNTV